MKLYIGRRVVNVDTIGAAKTHYDMVRNALDLKGPGYGGASRLPEGIIHGTGSKYRISYNGRVWDGVEREVTPADPRWSSPNA